MRGHARLNVTDDRVLCPSTCRWESVDHCSLCRDLAAIERSRDEETVIDGHPEVAPGDDRRATGARLSPAIGLR